IIHKLEQVYGDTDGEEKKITKWFLSTAYYFAYQTNKDSDNAVLLLEKAADYSPLTEKELAYSSNYDVVFLKGKKSYKEEYLDVLSSTQDKAIVLQHRSEEHTSELQSRENLVCRHLLEKTT